MVDARHFVPYLSRTSDGQMRQEGTLPLFQAKAFLTEYFKNTQTVLALFRHYGFEAPTVSAIEKWFQRDSISGHFLPILLCIAELEQGEPVRVARFMSRAG
jgi:hypothetical protein